MRNEVLKTRAMNWDRFNELTALQDAGRIDKDSVRIDEATAELTKLADAETDPLAKSIALIAVADGLVSLKRFSDARRKINEACKVVGPDHEYYPRAAFKAAMLDMHEKNPKGALKKLDEILEKYGAVLGMEDHRDLLDEVDRNRGIALADLKRCREAIPILERYRSEPYDHDRTLYYLGACEFELKDFDVAKRDFQEMLSLEPNPAFQAYAHRYLGTIFNREGQLARAKAEFEKCLACPDRGDTSEAYLLDWLIDCSKALNLLDEVERYSEMRKKLPTQSI
jgi:tetratricopeptide (TPR) repeat protein